MKAVLEADAAAGPGGSEDVNEPVVRTLHVPDTVVLVLPVIAREPLTD